MGNILIASSFLKNKKNFNKGLYDIQDLLEINNTLWDIEDKLRIKESKQSFDTEFIRLARDVYFTNDIRSEIKKGINIKLGSNLVEEKSYVEYNKI